MSAGQSIRGKAPAPRNPRPKATGPAGGKPAEDVRYLGAVRLSHLTDETTSPERQRDSITLSVKLRNGHLVAIVEDLDVSGSVSAWNRDLEPWLTDPKLVKLWDVLVVAKLDRLTRSLLDFQRILQWCEANGKTIISVAEGFDLSTPVGRLIANILVMFAEFERERMGERRSEAATKLKAMGYWGGGSTKYGTKPVKVDDHYEVVVDERQKAVANRMARDILAGKSACQIARDLTAEGIPTARADQKRKKGTPKWDASSIYMILRNAPPEVIDTETWTELQPIINAASKPKVNRYDARALSGVVFCAVCSGPLYGHNTKRGSTVWPYYRCFACSGNPEVRMIRTAELEAVVDEAVTEAYGMLPHISLTLIQGDDGERRRKELKRQASALDIEAADYDARIAEIRAELATIKPLPDAWQQIDTGTTVAEHWATLDATEKRQYLTGMGWKVYARAADHRGEPPTVTIDTSDPERDAKTLSERVNPVAWNTAVQQANGDLRRINVVDARTIIVRLGRIRERGKDHDWNSYADVHLRSMRQARNGLP
jgi:site-specific DNA recombinase